MDRDRLLTRFVESMQSPTASEKFFGQMLIVQREDLTFDVRPVSGGHRPSKNGEAAAPHVSDKPVLVVLTSKTVTELGPQGATGENGLPVVIL